MIRLKPKIVLFDIDYTLFDTETFKKSNLKIYRLYDETRGVLKKLAKFVEIGIFSQGEDEFQRKKLKQTLISNHFLEKNVHIFLDKDDNVENILTKYKDLTVFLVDDKLEILCLAKKIDKNVFTVWVKRGPFAKKEDRKKNFTPDVAVSNLKEIIAVILNT